MFLQFLVKNLKEIFPTLAHILHNAVHSSVDIFPFDIEHVINKMFNSFICMYTVCREKLKVF